MCRRFWISGRVQGVGFRATAATEAWHLGLQGYARNLPDGRVEILACGDADRLDALADWLATGPPLARVDEIYAETVADVSGESNGAFRIL